MISVVNERARREKGLEEPMWWLAWAGKGGLGDKEDILSHEVGNKV